MAADQLEIKGLRIAAWIGVPADERARPQPLSIDLKLTPLAPLTGLGDALEGTIDYEVVATQVRELVLGQKRRLLETVAEDIATGLLASHALREVEVEVRKFVLPHCDYVSVHLSRTKSD
ncbi:MAG: dihydroneopterin aldolase [Verrucomicrobiales bacterium]